MGVPRESSTCKWSILPENLKMKVLAWLPWEYLCRYCGVCKDWNALFSSSKFITEQWAVAPPNKKPCLVVCHLWGPLRCMAYCFFTNTWKTISLSVLTEKYSFLRKTEEYPCRYVWFDRSAAGLFLATLVYPEHGSRLGCRIVCNPLTGTLLKLPAFNDITILSTEFVAGDSHRQAAYEVVAVAESGNEQTVEIYDSSSKLWRTAGHLPQNLQANMSKFRKRMVFCEDVLYCLAKEIDSQTVGIAAFSIQDGTSIFNPLPEIEVGNYGSRLDHLLNCGSRILIATCLSKVSGILEDIIIWEFGKEKRTFDQIAEMPRENYLRNKYYMISFAFEGIGDLICIKYDESLEVFVYSLKENSWSELPACPIDDGIPDPPITTMFAFEPRPDMKPE